MIMDNSVLTGRTKQRRSRETDRAWIELNLNNLEHNARMLQEAMPSGCRLMAVVKAEAYGHGAREVSACLNRIGVNAFAVATIDEGIFLRRQGIRGEILILGYTDVNRAPELKKYDLTQTLIDYDYACALNSQGIGIKAHIKIDTGMHRLGLPWNEPDMAGRLFQMPNLKICGMYTHLSCSQSRRAEDISFTEEQISRFYGLTDALKSRNIRIPGLHVQSSYGLLNYPDLKCDYARIGIALYGVLSTPDRNTRIKLDLWPVLSLKAKIVCIKNVSAGEGVGYDRAFVAERGSRIAVLPIGYADGFPRNLSCQKGFALVRGRRVPIAGRICMDQMAVDVTDVPEACAGDIAVLIGRDGAEELSAPEVAEASDSISNELLSRLGERLPVVAL